jgi:hypothetical protein
VSKKSLGHSADASLGRFRIENVGGEVDPEPAIDLEADVINLCGADWVDYPKFI